MKRGSASGKVILLGEHAVVYGKPAIAVPLVQLRATAQILPSSPGDGLVLDLPDVDQRLALAQAPADHALAHVTRRTLAALGLDPAPDWVVTLQSEIPPASGLGSGAAAATAIARALSAAAGKQLRPDQISALVYESERLFHGTPSGIDNAVVAHELPIWFVRGQPPEPFSVPRPFTVIIADTGIPSPTKTTVGHVRQAWLANPAHLESLFQTIGEVVLAAREAIQKGELSTLGSLMDTNHHLLQGLGVSGPELDCLQAAAKDAGALGAKMSGGGRGGNLIALAPAGLDRQAEIVHALECRGATRVLTTVVGGQDDK